MRVSKSGDVLVCLCVKRLPVRSRELNLYVDRVAFLHEQLLVGHRTKIDEYGVTLKCAHAARSPTESGNRYGNAFRPDDLMRLAVFVRENAEEGCSVSGNFLPGSVFCGQVQVDTVVVRGVLRLNLDANRRSRTRRQKGRFAATALLQNSQQKQYPQYGSYPLRAPTGRASLPLLRRNGRWGRIHYCHFRLRSVLCPHLCPVRFLRFDPCLRLSVQFGRHTPHGKPLHSPVEQHLWRPRSERQ